jgi:hypothetical protein
MASGGFTRLPNGTVVVALRLPHPCGEESGQVRVLVVAANRQRALTRLRNAGLRAARLTGNSEPPLPDEINAVLHHPDNLVWRASPPSPGEPWHPVSTFPRASG